MSKRDSFGFIAAVILLASQLAPPAIAQNTYGNGPKWGGAANGPDDAPAKTKKGPLDETKVLEHNDQLMPGQNRTQAMRLEAESGHINPQVDAAVKPYSKKPDKVRQSPSAKPATKAKAAKKSFAQRAHNN